MILTKEKTPETAATVTSAQKNLSHLNDSTDHCLCKENFSVQEQILINLFVQTVTPDFDLASVNVFDSNRLDIRLGKGLSFIKQIVLSDGRVIHNLNYDGRIVTPTEIVETFKPFGANQGIKRTEAELLELMECMVTKNDNPNC